MDRLKELKEAKTAAEQVIARIDNATKSLDSAKSWGLWDIFGGEFFSSWIKRGKIQQANADINEISSTLDTLNKELEDVNMHLPAEISDTFADNVFDMWFDNIFTDLRVQGEIKDKLVELKAFRYSIINLINNLNAEITELEK